MTSPSSPDAIEPDVLRIPQLAQRLAMTPSAVHMAIARKSPAVPWEHLFKLGGRQAILLRDYLAWLEAKKAKA